MIDKGDVMEQDKPSKREVLRRMIGQAKLMEIIDQAYENAENCPNCKALKDWWEQSGAEIPIPEVRPVGQKARRR